MSLTIITTLSSSFPQLSLIICHFQYYFHFTISSVLVTRFRYMSLSYLRNVTSYLKLLVIWLSLVKFYPHQKVSHFNKKFWSTFTVTSFTLSLHSHCQFIHCHCHFIHCHCHFIHCHCHFLHCHFIHCHFIHCHCHFIQCHCHFIHCLSYIQLHCTFLNFVNWPFTVTDISLTFELHYLTVIPTFLPVFSLKIVIKEIFYRKNINISSTVKLNPSHD